MNSAQFKENYMNNTILEQLEALHDSYWPSTEYFGDTIRLDLRAIIEQHRQVAAEPFGYVLSINGELVFRKTITESESLVYSSMAVYCGDNRPVPSTVITAPSTDIIAELVKALEDDAFAATFQSMAGYRTALIAKVKGVVG